MCCSDFHHEQPQDSLELVNTSYGDMGWCKCGGVDGKGCCGYATKEDGYCDRCRDHCVPENHPVPAEAELRARALGGDLQRVLAEAGVGAGERYVETAAHT